MFGLQLLNYFAKKQNESKSDKKESNVIYSEVQKQYEAVTGEKKSNNTYKMQTNIIEQFLNKCNEQDIQGAYELLSEDCKKILYPSINNFIDGYYNKNFKEKKSYSYQVWKEDTYQIQLRQDILTTGIYSESAYTEDYYTIVDNKLNINRYIKRMKIDKEIEKYGIRIKVDSIDFFCDYSIGNIKVLNKTGKEILIDSGEKNNNVFLTDKNGVKFESFINELEETKIKVLKGENKNISIKFNCVYRKSLKITKMSFNNVIVDYEGDKEKIKKDNIKKIEVNI